MQLLSTETMNYSGCIWAGFSPIAAAFKQRHFNNEVDLDVDDGVLRRRLVVRAKGKIEETWVLASHLAVGVFSKTMGEAWYEALQAISQSSWRHPLKYRIYNETIGSVQAPAPAVRTSCTIHASYGNHSTVDLAVCTMIQAHVSWQCICTDANQVPFSPRIWDSA